MKLKALFLIYLFSVLLPSSGHASSAKVVELSISSSVPPYNMLDENVAGHPGIQIEIVNMAFKRLGMTVKWRSMTNNRAIKELSSKRIDGALNLSSFIDDSTPSGTYHRSLNILTFQNCLIGPDNLIKKGQTLEEFYQEILAKKELKILGFQGAGQVFKDVLKDLKNYPKYEEVPHQKILAASLEKGRSDLVLSDYLVFQYYLKRVHEGFEKNESQKLQKFSCLHQVPSDPRTISFEDKVLRDKIDVELKHIIESGEKEKIMNKYQIFLTGFLNESTSLFKKSVQVSFLSKGL